MPPLTPLMADIYVTFMFYSSEQKFHLSVDGASIKRKWEVKLFLLML